MRDPPTVSWCVRDIDRVERAALSLRAIEREILILSAGHGLSSREIAERLGLSEKRVERLLARALRKLDSVLSRRARPWWRFRSKD